MAEIAMTHTEDKAEYATEKQGLLRWHRALLGGILLLAIFMDFFQLGKNGFGSYYPPAVKSMLDNWHNFWFASYDPAGFVSIDKPPLGFWLQVLSARLFGFTPVSILLPQALAGVLSVLLLYHLVRRHSGSGAGLLAALALALSPISVVTNRNVTIDSTLVLVLLVGAWTLFRAIESGRLCWLLLAALTVGLGFNIKMLEAYLVVPAFVVLYLLAAPGSLRRRLGHLALSGLVLLVVSFSWITFVDLTPASQRPYVDSTQDNSELSLAIGYNGLNRLLGGGSSGVSAAGGNSPQQPQQPAPPPASGSIFDTGAPGPLRLFQQELGSQSGWLLPLALMSVLALAWQKRPNFRENRKDQALLLWSAWLLTMAIFFSIASFFHQYYLTIMAPAIAALVGMGVPTMWQNYRSGNWLGWLLPLALIATTAEQSFLLSTYPAWSSWLLPLLLTLSLVAVAVMVIARLAPLQRKKTASTRILALSLAIGIFALLLAPTTWAMLPILLSKQADTLLAGPPQAEGQGNFILRIGSQTFSGMLSVPTERVDPALIRYLVANQGQAKFLVAVPGSQDRADELILTTNKPVMALGGFSGHDPILKTEQFATLVKQGTIRFFLLPAPGQLPPQILKQIPGQNRDMIRTIDNGQNTLTTWIIQHCQTVPTPLWQSTPRASNTTGGDQLYDCAVTH